MRKTCYFCGAKWGSCTCKFDLHPDAGFVWCGCVVKEPCIDDSGRWFVDPVEYYGEAYVEWRDRKIATLSKLLARLSDNRRYWRVKIEPPYPWCIGSPTKEDCIKLGRCPRKPSCGD